MCESLDSESLYWKLNTWYMNREQELEAFHLMMSTLQKTPGMTLKDYEKLLNQCNLDWKKFVQFAMDNVDGTLEFDQLYMMKKISDILLANKKLSWGIQK